MPLPPAKPVLDATSANRAESTAPRRGLFPYAMLCSCLFLVLLAAVVGAVAVGAVSIPFERVVRIILGRVLPDLVSVDWTPVEEQIVWVFRLPRALLAILVGSGLAVSGAVLQALARNPLADPYIFGVSSGASFSAVAVMTLGSAALGGISLTSAAFAGALLTTILVYLLAQKGGRLTPMRLVLAGVALGYVLSAATSYLVLRGSKPGGSLSAVLFWLAGSLSRAKWEYLGLPAVVVLASTLFLMLQARPLNALALGDETAVGLGVGVRRFRLWLFTLTSLLVGTLVSVSGVIGFVGLMVPHIARMLVGADHARTLPLIALMGAVLMVLADVAARILLAPQELPVGIVLAAVGGPFFIWLLCRRQRGEGAVS